MVQDIRYALRGFARSPIFVLTVIVTVGLALGLNTAIFTVLDAYVLRPFAVHDPYSLYEPTWVMKDGGRFLTYAEFEQIRARTDLFAGAVAQEVLIASVEGRRLIGERVSADYFLMLGVATSVGRPFAPGDTTAMVLSDVAWKTKFASDPAILGKNFNLAGGSYTVVGIVRPEFNGLGQVPFDFWIPLDTTRGSGTAKVTVRLAPGVQARQAEAALAIMAQRMLQQRADKEHTRGLYLEPAGTALPVNAETVAVFAPVIVAFLLVLVIACANTANMMLARAAARQNEIGVRLLLGASRLRLVRQLLTESLLLAIPAATTGFFTAHATLRAADQLFVTTAPAAALFRIVPLELDARVFLFGVAAAGLAAVVFGLAPAIRATRSSVGFRSARLRHSLIVSEIACCALLLICAGVLLRGSRSMDKQDVGYTTTGVIDVEMQNAAPDHLIERLRTQTWVRETAVAWRAPLSGALRTLPASRAGSVVRWPYNFVSPEYFPLLDIPIVRGRTFLRTEAEAESPVTILSETTARRLFPNQDPLGKTIFIDPDPRIDRGKLPKFHTAEVVGIARDVTSGLVWDGHDSALFYFSTSGSHATITRCWFG